jgi:superfamily I DNA/RNA helicase
MIKNLFEGKSVKKIFGTAGSGKTTYLIKECENLFNQGVVPERIAFVSFTNKSVDEMVERMLEKFKKFDKKQFQNFRTIHAMAFQSSEIKRVMSFYDLEKVAGLVGLEISKNYSIEDGAGTKKGDKAIAIESLSRLRMVGLEEQWKACNFEDVPYRLVAGLSNQLKKYKKENNIIDFTDMLEKYSGGAINADYFFIDEAQDLSPLQWNVLNQMTKSCKKIFIAGDDDQAIYNWAGADVNYILNLKSEEEIVLTKSHRMPKNIYKLSRTILKKISVRKPKEFTPDKENGEISRISSLSDLKLSKNKDYLFLVRNRHQLKEIKERIEELGMPYKIMNKKSTDCDEVDAIKSWESFRKNKEISFKEFENILQFAPTLKKYDRNKIPENLKVEWFKIMTAMKRDKMIYFRRFLENEYRFSAEPRIKLSTIHQSKGGECENVIITTDVSYTTWKNISSDDEHRVWYVAISRCKQNLIIIQEQSNLFYRI